LDRYFSRDLGNLLLPLLYRHMSTYIYNFINSKLLLIMVMGFFAGHDRFISWFNWSFCNTNTSLHDPGKYRAAHIEQKTKPEIPKAIRM